MPEAAKEIPYLQRLWRIRGPGLIPNQSRLSNTSALGSLRHLQLSHVNPTMKPEKSKPQPLPEQIQVKHTTSH